MSRAIQIASCVSVDSNQIGLTQVIPEVFRFRSLAGFRLLTSHTYISHLAVFLGYLRHAAAVIALDRVERSLENKMEH